MIFMLPYTTPTELTDFNRLPEILALRHLCWQLHSKNDLRSTADNADALDFQSTHFVSFNLSGDIIAANRVTLMNDLSELPYYPLLDRPLYPDGPFVYFSKLVVHPSYRKQGLKEHLDKARTAFLAGQQVAYGLGFYGNHRSVDAIGQGFVSMEMISEGTERIYPYERRHLHVMTLPNHKMKELKRNDLQESDMEEV